MRLQWGQFRDNIRMDTRDTGATPRLSDELAFLYLCYAVQEYSYWNPRHADVLVTLDNTKSFAVPEDFIGEISLEVPLGRYLNHLQPTDGNRYVSLAGYPIAEGIYPKAYHVDMGKVFLSQPFTGQARLTYRATHLLPANKDDIHFEFGFPAEDERILNLGIRGYNVEAIRSKQANLDRFAADPGNRKNNPMAAESGLLLQEFRTQLQLKYSPRGSITLSRPRARRTR